MITLFMIVNIVGIIVALFGLIRDDKYYTIYQVMLGVCACVAFLLMWTFPYYISQSVDGKYIEEKIAMYEEENEKIESDIDVIAKQYMEHEGVVFDNAKVNSKITLVQLYPEMKSSEIVQKQMNVYNKNNAKIKKLKSERYKAKKARFLLYFGGN